MVRSLCSSGTGSKSSSACPARVRPSPSTWPAGRGSHPVTALRRRARAEAAAQLEAGSEIPSVTLDRLLYELSAPPHLSRCSLDPRSIVVVDEASMVDTRRLVRLLEIAQRVERKRAHR